jgi:maltooligosyltrehalose trehalohydrolase
VLGLEAPLGATLAPDGHVEFRLWAPRPRAVELVLEGPEPAHHAMAPADGGYRELALHGLVPGTRYRYRLDGGPLRADPASRGQPFGVPGPSEIVDPDAHRWSDEGWRGRPREELVLYELHVGTFSPEGTFAGVASRLPRLVELGITAVEIMPVGEFPGTRNWGYDGIFPFAVQHTYGGLAGLQALADECHRAGLAILLDFIPNHVGPEGNYLAEFGPYFTDAYRTPWGAALNFSEADSDPVRRYFVEAAAFLVRAAHLDGLRVDAVHAVVDPTARPFFADLTESLHPMSAELGHPVHLIAESALNDPRVVRPVPDGGFGFDAMWNDDLHHALHAHLTGETTGYYTDFGPASEVERGLVDGFVLSGRYSVGRRRRHGVPVPDLPGDRFVVFAQNHDQVGNRPLGERLSALVPPEALRVAAGLVLLSPYLPLLFMGEEYAETAPFLFFTDHGDPALGEAVRAGRRAELATGDLPAEAIPDPQARETFERSRLNEELAGAPGHRELRTWYRELLALRRELGPAPRWGRDAVIDRAAGGERLALVGHAGRSLVLVDLGAPPGAGPWVFRAPPGAWTRRLDSASARYGGRGPELPERLERGRLELPARPRSLTVYVRGAPGG